MEDGRLCWKSRINHIAWTLHEVLEKLRTDRLWTWKWKKHKNARTERQIRSYMKHLADRRESTVFINGTEQVVRNRTIREVISQTQGWHIGRETTMETNESWNKPPTNVTLGLIGNSTETKTTNQTLSHSAITKAVIIIVFLWCFCLLSDVRAIIPKNPKWTISWLIPQD